MSEKKYETKEKVKLDEILDIKTLMKEDEKKTTELVTDAYKKVFQGHPWHEDYICKNALEGKCYMQFTKKACEKIDQNRKTGEITLDCSNGYAKREGITLLTDDLTTCPSCGDKLDVIEFYPTFADHKKIFKEAVEKEGFIGNIGSLDNKIVAFSWGYKVPKKPTTSVRFDMIRSLLEEKGLKPEETFYFAETGVVDEFQDKGLGSASSYSVFMDAYKAGSKYMVARTINVAFHAMVEKLFGGKKGQLLFKDPEREGKWFMWEFKDFDKEYAQNKIASKVKGKSY